MFKINFNKKDRQKGMSLLEVMVSFSILVVVFISLAQTFPTSSSINKSAENATEASYLAQAEVEEITSLGYDNITVGTIEAKHRLSSNSKNYLYYFQRKAVAAYVNNNLADSATDQGLKKVTVTVYYTDALSKTEKTYTTTFLITAL